MPGIESKPWNYEDYRLLPDDGQRHEILAGEHVVTPAPGTRHQTLVVRLVRYLGDFLDQHPVGSVFTAPCDVLLEATTIVQPDVFVVLESGAAVIETAFVRGAPDLVIEVLSESTRRQDLLVKRKLYQQMGVGELWLVDPEGDTVTVFDESIGASPKISVEQPLASSVLEGFTLDLDRLFAS